MMGIQAKSSGQTLDTSELRWNRATSSMERTEAEEPTTGIDTLSPVAGWFMYKLEEPSRAKEKEEEIVSPHGSLPPRMKTGSDKDNAQLNKNEIPATEEVRTKG